MPNCLLVDDDEMSRRTLEELIKKIKNWKLIASCSNVIEARDHLQNYSIDVLFLDVEMPDITGLEFLKMLTDTPEVVIVSSKEKYALDAFEYEVTDYLLKPVSPERFLKTVTRIENRLASDNENYSTADSVFVKANNQVVKIMLQDILWVEAYGDYVSIFTDKDRYVIHATMKGIEGKLPSDQFLRVHRSFIIRVDKINAIEDTLIVIGKKLIPIGESFKTELMSRLKFL
ncbi:MAG: response regulator transcription factor [Bacteroidetes bacterium]|nr:response regulator transcription factor [Bacteroidota bacterium]